MEDQINQKELSNLEQKLLRDFHGNPVIIDYEQTALPYVDENCAEYFKTMLSHEDFVIRVAITGGGCSGFQYEFYIEEINLIEAQDVQINESPIVIIDSESLKFMRGAVIKLEDTEVTQRVYIDNPGATQSCGCGSSFNYDFF